MARHAMRYRGTGRCGPDLGELSWQATAPTPASFMLDARLTPLERNRCRALRRASPLANLGKLRRYLTSTPLGQSAGYETIWRVLGVLRLTVWWGSTALL